EGVVNTGISQTTVESLSPGEKRVLTFQVKVNVVTDKFKPKYMVAISAEAPNNQRAVDFQYILPSKVYTSIGNGNKE
ncbi:MAG: hypothetical protein PHF84_02425, partial [bacterium]|nr:hypothetical protein [bacterium]